MKKTVLFSTVVLSLGAATLAQAEEMGRVLSTTPVMQQVAVPRQVCNTAQVATPSGPSGAGAAMGAVAGGFLGNQVGHGSGRAAATALGLLGGAVLGNNIEGNRGTQVQNVQQCTTQTFYETRTVGYNVLYEYAGKQYNVQMPNDPGPYVRLQITPIGSGAPMAPTSRAEPTYGQPVYSQSPYVQPAYVQPAYVQPAYVQPAYVQQTTYVQPAVVYGGPAYYRPYYRPYYAPIGFSLNLGYSNSHGGGHHWR
ncbi:MAG: glycine zipper 2TM domain-containing protein [Burkholderiaceae bacterium]|nr:glycine zipper 2TM domain-containing protein [Burkholderiaceae bacterium]